MPVQGFGHLFVQASTPSEAPVMVGSLWSDKSGNLKVCTSTTPYTFASIGGGGGGTVDLTTGVTGVLPVANGGTNVSQFNYKTATVVLTNDQIVDLPNTPIVIVAAPGIGKWLVPFMCAMETDFSNGFYTFSTGNPFSPVQGDSDIVVTYDFNVENAFRPIPMAYIGGADATKRSIICPPYSGVSTPVVAEDQLFGHALNFTTDGKTDNKPFCVSADNSGAFGGGGAGNTLTVTVWYAVRTYSSATP